MMLVKKRPGTTGIQRLTALATVPRPKRSLPTIPTGTGIGVTKDGSIEVPSSREAVRCINGNDGSTNSQLLLPKQLAEKSSHCKLISVNADHEHNNRKQQASVCKRSEVEAAESTVKGHTGPGVDDGSPRTTIGTESHACSLPEPRSHGTTSDDALLPRVDGLSLHSLMSLYDLHTLTLFQATGSQCHGSGGESDNDDDVSQLRVDQLVNVSAESVNQSCLGDLPRQMQGSDRGQNQRCRVTDDVTLVSVTSVSSHLLSVDGGRRLVVGDVFIEINGSYVVGRSVEDVQEFLAMFNYQPLRLVVASRRFSGPLTSRSQSSDCCSMNDVRNEASEREQRTVDDGDTAYHHVIDLATCLGQRASVSAVAGPNSLFTDDAATHQSTVHPCTHGQRHSLSDVTTAGANENDVINRKQRSVSFGVEPTGRSSLKMTADRFDGTDQTRRQQDHSAGVLRQRPAPTGQFAGASLTTDHHTHVGSGVNLSPMTHRNPAISKQTVVNGHHCETLYINYLSNGDSDAKASRFNSSRLRSPRPNWLKSAVRQGRNGDAAEIGCRTNMFTGFVPLKMSDDDDSDSSRSCSSRHSSNSGSSLAEEVMCYDEYGWQCVTAV